MEVVVGDEAALLAARWLARRVRAAIVRRGAATLAVSGGSTAEPMLTALAALSLEWSAVTIWQVDERVAPGGSPARNAGQLDAFAHRPCRVRLMPVTAADLRRAARRYGAGLPPRFDVVHLGLGDDGHTASWPPGDVDVVRSREPVAVVPTFRGFERMTLTPGPINAARARLVLAVGASKRPVVARWLLDDRSLPIAAVRRAATTLFLDPAAAPGV